MTERETPRKASAEPSTTSAATPSDTEHRPILGVMLRCHVRYRSLDIVLAELRRYHREMGIDVRICAMLDRASPDVQDCVEGHFAKHLAAGGRTLYIEAPRRQLDAEGEHFMEGLSRQMDFMEDAWPDMDWVFAADDDRTFEPVKITEELPRALADDSKDVYFCRSLFFWDDSTKFNTSRQHDSALLYRFKPGYRWSGNRMLNVPDALYDQAVMEGRVGTISTPLFDWGTLTADDRLRVYTAFSVAGKLDAYVRSIYDTPALLRFPDDFSPNYGRWRDLWKERWGG